VYLNRKLKKKIPALHFVISIRKKNENNFGLTVRIEAHTSLLPLLSRHNIKLTKYIFPVA